MGKVKKYLNKIKTYFFIKKYLNFENFNYKNFNNNINNNLNINPIILHISDIPYNYYRYIYNLIELLNPVIVINTGDIIDNLKLEFNEKLKREYNEKIRNIIYKSGKYKNTIFIFLEGNHDDFNFIFNGNNDINYLNKENTKEKKSNLIFLPTKFENIEQIYEYFYNLSNIDYNSLNNNYNSSKDNGLNNNNNNAYNSNKKDFKEVFDFNTFKITVTPELSVLSDKMDYKEIYDNFAYSLEFNQNKMNTKNLKLIISHMFIKEIYKNYDFDYYLFGHNLFDNINCKKEGFINSNCKILNGLNYVNLIEINKKNVIKIRYPSLINECRKIRTGFIRGM